MPAPPYVEPAEAARADPRQAVHGAHHQPAQAARVRRRHRHRRLPAAGDPQLLRHGGDARRRPRLLGRGVAGRDGRLRPPRRRPAGRHLPRHLRRRAVRRRPRPARAVPPGEAGVGHDRPEVRRQPARVRDRRHGRGRPHRALPREAVVGPGVLRHDQHRHLRARARGAEAHPERPSLRLLEGALPAAARDGPPDVRLRPRRLLAGHREPRPISPGELRRARREVRLDIAGVRLRGNIWLGEGVDVHDLDAIEGPAYLGNYCRVAPEATVGPYSVLSTSVTLRERARTTRSIIDASTYLGRSALVEGAIVGRSCDLRAHVRVHEGVAIGDEVTIGAESVIMPGVRIYPYKEVETGAHLFESLIWESRGTARIFGKEGVSGLVNVDLTPDVAVRLAAALGTALKRGARIVASRDGTPACRMIKRAMISGLSSTGVDVADLRV